MNRGMILGLLLLCGCGDSDSADSETNSPREACIEQMKALGLRKGFDIKTGTFTMVGCSSFEGKTAIDRRTLALVDALAEAINVWYTQIKTEDGEPKSGFASSQLVTAVTVPWEFNGISIETWTSFESFILEEEATTVERFTRIIELRVDGEVYVRSRMIDEAVEATLKGGVTAESLIALLNDRGIPCEILFASETRQESAVVLTCRLPGMRKR